MEIMAMKTRPCDGCTFTLIRSADNRHCLLSVSGLGFNTVLASFDDPQTAEIYWIENIEYLLSDELIFC